MPFQFRRIAAVAAGLLLISCASSPLQRLENVKVGMDKTAVLDAAGSPKWTQRKNGGDLWVYVHYQGETRMERGLRFENGVLIEILPDLEANASADASSSDVIIRDYEKLVDDAKKGQAQKSKFVPVGEDD